MCLEGSTFYCKIYRNVRPELRLVLNPQQLRVLKFPNNLSIWLVEEFI